MAVASLALGIGANTIIFTLAKGVLFDRLAVPQPEQLRLLGITIGKHPPMANIWGDFHRSENGQHGWIPLRQPSGWQLQDHREGQRLSDRDPAG